MLFKIRSLLPVLACVLATGHLVTSAPHADLSSPEQPRALPGVFGKPPDTMDHWAGSKKDGSESWKKVLKSPFATAVTAKLDAKEGYDYVMGKTDSKHKDDTQLVAALFIASGPGKGVYLSSIPKGPATALMSATAAPAWAHQVAGRTPKKYHAEDGAMWLFEDALGTKLGATAQYPHGSTIYVYGHFKDDKGKAGVPGYQPPCSVFGTVPSCTDVLEHLDIIIGKY